MPKRDRFEEHSVKIRANKKGSRPRTKDRPAHAHAETALVVAVDRGRYRLVMESAGEAPREVTAMRARELGRQAIVPGDRVAVTGDTTGNEGSLCRIVRIEERSTLLRRSADDSDPVERALVANADQLVIVTALANPQPRPRMIDRCIIAALDAGLKPLLCLTKADLADAEAFVANYAPIGVDYVITEVQPDGTIMGLDVLQERLTGHLSALVGHSGVGKSTLVNALAPAANRATGHVNDVTGRGRHTSSSALAIRLAHADGWVIDTPGVRSFGLAHIAPEDLLHHFHDLAELAEQCPRGCAHTEAAPDCALDALTKSGDAGAPGVARLESFRRLLQARLAADSYGN